MTEYSPSSHGSGPASEPEGGGIRRLSQEVVRLTRASHLMRAQLGGRGVEGVEWAAYPLLFELVKTGPQRSSELAAAACVDPSTISRQVAQLVTLGLVERRADPADGRATQLLATDAGHRVYDAVRERRERAFAEMVADWSQDDVRTLATLLNRLNDSFQQRRGQILDIVTGVATRTEETV